MTGGKPNVGGRPAVGDLDDRGRSKQWSLILWKGQTDAVDAAARALRTSRAQLLREFVDAGLAAPVERFRRPPPAGRDARGKFTGGTRAAAGGEVPRYDVDFTWISGAGQAARLDERARQLGVSRAEVVRRFVEAALAPRQY